MSVLTSMLLSFCIFIVPITTVMAIDTKQNDYTNDEEISLMTNSVSIEGSNGFGNLLSDKLTAKENEQQENMGNNIFSVEVDKNVAKVEFETTKDCTVVVGIYDEQGVQMLTSANASVSHEQKSVNIKLDSKKVPDYFYIKAFLIESDTLKPVCTAYESPNYTKEMQELLNMTTDDFDSKRVFNLDNDKTNNFAIYDEDTKVIAKNGSYNKVASVNDSTKTYVIKNIDSSISSLKQGDVFAYEYETNNILIVKVSSISISNGTATIKGQDTSLEEVFDYIKIDNNTNNSSPQVDTSASAKGVTYKGLKKSTSTSSRPIIDIDRVVETKFAFGIAFEVEKTDESEIFSGSVKVNGEAEFSVGASLKVYLTWKYQYIRLKIDYNLKLAVGVTGAAKTRIPLAKIDFSPIPGLYIGLTPSIVFRIEAKIELNVEFGGTLGFKFSNEEGLQNISTRPQTDSNFKIEGSVFLGIDLRPEIVIIHDKIIRIYLSAEAGIEVKSILFEASKNQNDDIRHSCKLCLSYETNGKFSISTGIKIFNSNNLKFELKLLEVTSKIRDYYHSYDYNEWGEGTCPHKEYKVTVQAYDSSSHSPLSDVVVNYNSKNYHTNSNGQVDIYMTSGEHEISCSKTDYDTQKKQTTVLDEAKEIVIYLNKISSPTPPPTNDGFWYEVTTNLNTTAAIYNNDMYMWGDNIRRQIGNGTTTDQLIPYKVLSGVKSISLGMYHSSAITNNDDLYMWGDNIRGQIGNGTTTDQLIPYKVLSGVKSILLGKYHNSAITNNGDLYMWGDNGYGQIGNGTTTDQLTPCKVLSGVKSVSLGIYHSSAITNNGDLYMWGSNGDGQIGNGTTTDRLIPYKVLSGVKSVSLGNYCSSAITNNDDLYMWGDNGYGQIGNGTTTDQLTPYKVLSGVKSISLENGCISAAITNNDDLYVWGYNGYGQIGNGTTQNQLTPYKVLSGVKSISLGIYHSSAITNNDDLYMWGDNIRGQIGNGTTTDQLTPCRVLSGVKSISLGMDHSSAITNNDDLYMWGDNFGGAIGNGTTTDQLTPCRVLSGVRSVSLGTDHSSAVTNDGDLYVWGYNGYGQIGNGTNEYQLTPYKVTINTTKTTSTSATTVGNNKKYTGLLPNEVYNFYIVKSKTADDVLATGNLLYITQGKTDENGNLSVTYKPKETVTSPQMFIVGMSKIDISQATVSISDMDYNGKVQYVKPVVKYNGTTLTEGIDYELSGSYSATKIGKYTVTITGMREYTGSIHKQWNIKSTLKNNSKISATSISLGKTVTITGSATGGTTPYKYAVLYKQSAQSKWTAKQDFSTNTSVSITPATATTYDVCVKVQDKDGTIEKKYFTVKVSNNALVNNSTVSATSIKLGSSVNVKCAATGGTTPYKYAVFYKQSAQSKWTTAAQLHINMLYFISSLNSQSGLQNRISVQTHLYQ